MRKIKREVLENMEDPIAQMVWQKWIREGKAQVIEPYEEVQKCQRANA